jgi:hypothetical protein
MRILKHPRVVAWLAGSFVIMCLSAILSIYGPDKTYMTVITILLATLSGSIIFPILVGYFTETFRERESGEAIWKVFKEFGEGGMLRVYKDREQHPYLEDGIDDLQQAFMKHDKGAVKLIGVTLRVFFNQTGPFYQAISNIVIAARDNENIGIKVLLSHPDSPEVLNRAAIETPAMAEPLIKKDIALTAANIDNLRNEFAGSSLEYGYYKEAPYCTLIIFPDKCYYSSNILSKEVPVRLPLIVFASTSHGYKMLNNYFDYLWLKRINLQGSKLSN